MLMVNCFIKMVKLLFNTKKELYIKVINFRNISEVLLLMVKVVVICKFMIF